MLTSDVRKNLKQLKILGEKAFVEFMGVMASTHQEYIEVSFDDGSRVKCSVNHMLKCDMMGFVPAKFISVGDSFSGKTVTSVERKNEEIVLYDILESEDHTYISNGVVSHNCVFISDKGTLINSRILEGLPHVDPLEELGDLRLFVSDFKGRKLAMACDCGEGVGQDYHAIQIIDIEKMEQVGEYQNNILPQTQFTKEIVRIVKFLYGKGAADVFYTVENNGVGNGVMRLIESVQDPVFSQATMISQPGAKKLGMATTGKNKIAGCMQLKDMIELGVLKINSERLLTQLRFFVKSGASYAAESGANDDLCMAMVVLMNMLVVLGDYEESVSDVVSELSLDSPEDESWGIIF